MTHNQAIQHRRHACCAQISMVTVMGQIHHKTTNFFLSFPYFFLWGRTDPKGFRLFCSTHILRWAKEWFGQHHTTLTAGYELPTSGFIKLWLLRAGISMPVEVNMDLTNGFGDNKSPSAYGRPIPSGMQTSQSTANMSLKQYWFC